MSSNREATGKILWELVENFRSSLSSSRSLELALQILAWAKLSEEKSIPEALTISRFMEGAEQELLQFFEGLSKLGICGAAFTECPGLEPEGLIPSLNTALRAAQFGLLSPFDHSVLQAHSQRDSIGFCSVPPEVIALMIGLVDSLSDQTVYCPYELSALLATEASEQGAKVAFESPSRSVFPDLIRILTGTSFQVQFGDPVIDPNYRDGRKLRRFDLTLSFLPFGVRYKKDIVQQDLLGRFPESTPLGEILQLRHLLAQTQGQAIAAVNQSVLFSGSAAQALRQDLVSQGIIKAVIEMPPALLPFTGVNFSILILDSQGGNETIRFVDGSNAIFHERSDRRTSRLSNWEGLLETYQDDKADPTIARTVAIGDILKEEEAILSVSRHLFSKEKEKTEKVLKASQTQTLNSLVQILRPVRKAKDDEGIGAYEVSVLEFPEFGYLAQPENAIALSDAEMKKKGDQAFLRPHDLIITIRGNTGLIAIAPENVPAPSEEGWVVNQSCLILRAKKSGIDPRVLFLYLRSGVGQTLLKGLVAGATMPLIQLKALRQLPVIVPSAAEQAEVIQTFEEIADLQTQIETIKSQQRKKSQIHWSIDSDR